MTISKNSDGIRFGIAGETNVQWAIIRSGVYLGALSLMSNMYLVENPSKEELDIKQKIQDKINLRLETNAIIAADKKALKAIPAAKLQIGAGYKDENGYEYLYLGFGSCEGKEGYMYINYKRVDELITTGYLTWFNVYEYKVLKNRKKLVEMTHEPLDMFNSTNEFVVIVKRWGEEHKLVFKLHRELP